MIQVEEAQNILEKIKVYPSVETVPVGKVLNRILGQDIVSKINMPPFDKSAMDGYAFNSGDTSEKYLVVEVIPAGTVPEKILKKGQCSKIMTGGMVPQGADRVIKRELTEEKDGFMSITGADLNQNICFQGEDIGVGDLVLRKGVLIRAPEIGIIASMGLSAVKVFTRPLVGIIATGSEILEPGRSLENGKIYDSNSYSLSAQVFQSGAVVNKWDKVEDTQEGIRASISGAIETCDVVLISGGVSAGDFDYVPGILKELGVQLHFEKIAVKPGKPTVFGSLQNKMVFGVPGNPVSTFVIFEIFIKPLLYRMMGHEYVPVKIRGIMKSGFSRKKARRQAHIPVRYNEGSVELLDYHGSAHFHALCRANGLILIPEGVREISAGSQIDVRQIF